MPESKPPATEPPNPENVGDASPRAFATATGFALQLAGLAYLGSGLIFWLGVGRFLTAPIPPPTASDDTPPARVTRVQTVTTINILAAVTAGLAMASFGLGLQGERPSAGTGAVITTAGLALLGWLSLILLLIDHAWGRSFLVLIESAGATILFLLSGHAAAVLRRHPPPPGQNVVTDQWLEQHHARRRHH